MNMLTQAQKEDTLKTTQKWLETIIIGLNLCPFAKAPFQKGQVHFEIAEANTMKGFVEAFIKEVQRLDTQPSIETTLMIVPTLGNIEHFQSFMQFCEETIIINHWGSKYQIVSFHPLQRLQGFASDSPRNLISIAPYPIVHILRVASVETLGKNLKEDVQVKNDQILNNLNSEEVKMLWYRIVS
ncbi:MAG: DUF1415 family protein [Microscillaceae bacterium]|nr:DUF1415 family protein [Microscillaceae bacterium]